MKPSIAARTGRLAGLMAFVSVLALRAGGDEKKPVLTFLDTLNKGREVSVAAADVASRTAPAMVTAPPQAPAADLPAAEPKREEGVVASRFKIQICASTQEQQVRQEKNNLTEKIKLAQIELPVTVAFETPYYKLFAGDFAQRSEAENSCAQLKKIGYNDAWIVRTATPQR
jgi:septal ring-binding cell division protein DamX